MHPWSSAPAKIFHAHGPYFESFGTVVRPSRCVLSCAIRVADPPDVTRQTFPTVVTTIRSPPKTQYRSWNRLPRMRPPSFGSVTQGFATEEPSGARRAITPGTPVPAHRVPTGDTASH